MSPFISAWVLVLVSPLQQAVNRFIPVRLQPVSFMALAALLVVVFTIVTPLDWPAFPVQVREVFAALTVGWILSKPFASVRVNAAAVGTAFLAIGVFGIAPGILAQTDSVGVALPSPREAVAGEVQVWLSYFFGWLGSLISRKIRGRAGK
jgi:hypothetical protein